MSLRQQRKLERRERVIDAAAELIAARQDSDFSMQELAQRGGVSARTLYNLFESKGDVLLTLTARLVGELDAELETIRDEDPIERSRKITLLPAQFVFLRPALCVPLTTTRIVANTPRLGACVRQRQNTTLQEAADGGLLLPHVDPNVVSFQLMSQVTHSSLNWGLQVLTGEGMLALIDHHWTLVMSAVTVEPVRKDLLERLTRSQSQISQRIHELGNQRPQPLHREVRRAAGREIA